MPYHQTAPDDIKVLRVLDEHKNARLIAPRRGFRGTIVTTDFRRSKAKTFLLPDEQAKWMITGGMVTPHKRESAEPGKRVLAVTTRGRSFAVRDLRTLGTRPATEGPKVKDLILKAVQKAGKDGITAAAINLHLLSRHNIQLHYKTVGMSLYRFSQEKLVRRKGRGQKAIWFAVQPKAVKAKPARSRKPKAPAASAPIDTAVQAEAPATIQ